MSGATHTKGPWRIGKGRSVVADVPVPEMRGSEAVDFYGGHMVAESVTALNQPIIAAAPEMFEALNALFSNPHVDLGDLVYQIREREGEGWEGAAVKGWSEAITKAKAAIAKATGKEGA